MILEIPENKVTETYGLAQTILSLYELKPLHTFREGNMKTDENAEIIKFYQFDKWFICETHRKWWDDDWGQNFSDHYDIMPEQEYLEYLEEVRANFKYGEYENGKNN